MIDLPAPDPGIEIVLASRGMSKGLAQTDGVQISGRGELVFGDVSFGALFKNIDSPTAAGEFILSAGYKKRLGGFEFGGTLAYKMLTGTRGQRDPDCIELTPSISRAFGPFTARVSAVWSPNDFGAVGRSVYLEGGGAYKLSGKTSVGAGFARRERDGGPDYSAFNLGITHRIRPNISADLRYHDTSRSSLGDRFESRFTAALRAKF